MGELLYRIKNDLRFSREEVKEILICSLAVGVIFALRLWQDATLLDLIIALIISSSSIFFHVGFQKAVGLSQGFSVDFKLGWIGIMTGIIFCLFSQGWFWWVIIPGGVKFSLIAKYRLGKFRYGLNYFPMGLVALSGAIGSIIFGSLFKNIDLYLSFLHIPSGFLHSFFIFNLAYAAMSVLPFPPFDGHYLFYGSRNWYAIISITIIAYAILAGLEFYSWIIAIIIGLVGWLLYYLRYEKKF